MVQRKGKRNVRKPVARKPADPAPVSGAADQGGKSGVRGVALDAAAANKAGAAADTGAAAGASLANGSNAANADPAAAAGAAGAAATEAKGQAPLYNCHKQVRALKLTDITRNNDTGQVTLTPEDKSFEPFDAPPGWYERFHGENDTGYFVQYEDGFASWSPTKAFEDGYTLMPTIQPYGDFDVTALAAFCAGGARLLAGGGPSVVFDCEFSKDEAAVMADFVRDNPDAPVPAMFIHLGLQKRYPRTEPSKSDLFVLSLFHAACKAAIQFEADRAAEEAAAKAQPAPACGWPGEQTLKPSDPAFAPTGFSPR